MIITQTPYRVNFAGGGTDLSAFYQQEYGAVLSVTISKHMYVMEITTIGDVPAGTGMGPSSTLTVGLLHALHAYRGQIINRHRMAEEACKIEIDILGKPIGRQDQYAAAFGGLNYIRFNPGHTVDVEPVPCRAETLAELEKRTILMYTNQKRDANSILGKQSQGVRRYRVFRRDFFASDKADHAAILEYASGKWWFRR
jgi:D-glycero-alpha-D-manno-heptose-7-phosphate kinase